MEQEEKKIALLKAMYKIEVTDQEIKKLGNLFIVAKDTGVSFFEVQYRIDLKLIIRLVRLMDSENEAILDSIEEVRYNCAICGSPMSGRDSTVSNTNYSHLYICSTDCRVALYKGVGKSFDQRRLDAGIEKYEQG